MKKKPTKPSPIDPPDLDDADSLETHPVAEPPASRVYEDLLLDQIDWSEQTASRVSFTRSILRGVRLAKCKLRGVQLRDVRIEGGDLSLADWLGASLHRVEILSTRLSGFNSAESTCREVVFRNCKLSYAIFQFATFDRCLFENCDLVDATFQGATLREITFRGCNLTNAQFSDAHLEAIDLRGSILDGTQIPLTALRSITIDPNQTTPIALLTQVQIKPPED